MGGTLPGQPPLRTWGGQGSGALCALCAETIGPDQCEYEFEYANASPARGRAAVHVHVECYSVWERARPAAQVAQTGLGLGRLSGSKRDARISRRGLDPEHGSDSS